MFTYRYTCSRGASCEAVCTEPQTNAKKAQLAVTPRLGLVRLQMPGMIPSQLPLPLQYRVIRAALGCRTGLPMSPTHATTHGRVPCSRQQARVLEGDAPWHLLASARHAAR